MPLRIASYASGHGLGHATRVSALAEALRGSGHHVFVCSNAPEVAFDGALARGAQYRNVAVDAGFVQPTAYTVDRAQTVANLEAFLAEHDDKVEREAAWLRQERIDLVLVDAPFLPCAAAAAAKIPSIIVSNFTFDSCYSYLSVGQDGDHEPVAGEEAKATVDDALLHRLVQQTTADYAHASLLLRLPGAIPIPAFDTSSPLPPTTWVDKSRHGFTTAIRDALARPPFNVIDVPLIVRPTTPQVYTEATRAALYDKLGVPANQRSHRLALVSFGGQRPPRPRPRESASSAVPVAKTRGHKRHHSLPAVVPGQTDDDLLSPGFIAIVCGLAVQEEGDPLPERFYRCPKDAYIPDLTALADVVLGKLGYGTCSETLATSTPFIYVPRPLFLEEYGLKRLMEQHGTALELDRTSFEEGRWAQRILEASEAGREAKAAARRGERRSMGEGAAQVIVQRIEDFMAHRDVA